MIVLQEVAYAILYCPALPRFARVKQTRMLNSLRHTIPKDPSWYVQLMNKEAKTALTELMNDSAWEPARSRQ
jgi:hypothetical protein